MTTSKEKYASKIAALMEIAENDASTEAEITNAMGLARKLMLKHEISEEEAKGAKGNVNAVNIVDVYKAFVYATSCEPDLKKQWTREPHIWT